ncbi:MAG: HAD family hydrolase [Chloroflexi bacterium]|nr:HAD family hydrolase [Chloroflexota bacterium]MCY3696811.1 HAD family hydrolase [Chloroflexota bacterium]
MTSLNRARPRFESVIFDLDGTLADTEPLVLGCMLETINAHGHPVDEERLLKYIGPPLPVMLFNMLGLSPEQAHPIYMDYLRRYERSYMPKTRPLPGAEALLDELDAVDVPLAVVTNKREDAGRKTVELLGWTDRFRTIIGADTASDPKPHPAPLLHALDILGGAPDAAAMVGDTESDMGAGRNAGFAGVIGIVGLRDADFLLSEGATAVADDLPGVGALLFDR